MVCASSTGTVFGDGSQAPVRAALFSDSNGWNLGPQYYTTIRLP
jgi:hypothetical protein